MIENFGYFQFFNAVEGTYDQSGSANVMNSDICVEAYNEWLFEEYVDCLTKIKKQRDSLKFLIDATASDFSEFK